MQEPRKGAWGSQGNWDGHANAATSTRPGQRALVCVWVGAVSVWEGDCLVPGSPGGLRSPSLAGGHGNKRSGLCCRCLRWAHDDTAASPPYTARLAAAGQEAVSGMCVCPGLARCGGHGKCRDPRPAEGVGGLRVRAGVHSSLLHARLRKPDASGCGEVVCLSVEIFARAGRSQKLQKLASRGMYFTFGLSQWLQVRQCSGHGGFVPHLWKAHKPRSLSVSPSSKTRNRENTAARWGGKGATGKITRYEYKNAAMHASQAW